MSEFEFDDVVSILLGVKSEIKIFQKNKGLKKIYILSTILDNSLFILQL